MPYCIPIYSPSPNYCAMVVLRVWLTKGVGCPTAFLLLPVRPNCCGYLMVTLFYFVLFNRTYFVPKKKRKRETHDKNCVSVFNNEIVTLCYWLIFFQTNFPYVLWYTIRSTSLMINWSLFIIFFVILYFNHRKICLIPWLFLIWLSWIL